MRCVLHRAAVTCDFDVGRCEEGDVRDSGRGFGNQDISDQRPQRGISLAFSPTLYLFRKSKDRINEL